ncbi:PREDICTED: vomeronasal type-1 receptor 1-like [Elephantulus edwardii]|uniref:vomeronasal type-1 receptor 1-like n=1 Tax=Elephantulus edwardii TaxID=28737 RepID=UPI0003F0B352|nr:PREDICTED: vomeronasal type-1 receptor 1-like [Elephantulus edwardii]
MDSASIKEGMLFLTQTGVGILGNASLLCLYNFHLITGHMLKPTDLILSQLVLANSLVLFSKGIPHTMTAFGLQFVLGDTGCRLVFYLHRVSRGVSLSTTCLLSGFQAIKLSPDFSRWMELRMRSPKSIGFCCFLCWILHLLLNSTVPLRMCGPQNSTNSSRKIRNFGFCHVCILGKLINAMLIFILSSIDAMHLGIMVWASGSMVLVLHKHKKRVQHIHSNRLSPGPSPEARATSTVLVLVSMFVSFYTLSSTLTLYVSVVESGRWLVHFSVFAASCFPAFSPLVLISRHPHFLVSLWFWGSKRTFL